MAKNGQDFDPPILTEEKILITKKTQNTTCGENQKNS